MPKRGKRTQPQPVATAATTAPATLQGLRRRRLFGSRAGVVRVPEGSLVAELAAATATDRLVLAALKAAHGWSDDTRLTREDFERARDEWLAQPGRGRRAKRKVAR